MRTAHRRSVDFDFFSDLPLDEEMLRKSASLLDNAVVLHRAPDTLDVSVPVTAGAVKVSFFGGLRFGRVSTPEVGDNGVEVAGMLDLLAIKLKVLLQRVEVKDYLDIDALLASGVPLAEGLAAAAALFPRQLNPLDAVKAVAWFHDGGLATSLPLETRRRLTVAADRIAPGSITPMPLTATRLSAR